MKNNKKKLTEKELLKIKKEITKEIKGITKNWVEAILQGTLVLKEIDKKIIKLEKIKKDL